jgi:hypothetical protein
MNSINCTVYDCEFDQYSIGVIIDNIVYILDKDKNPALAREFVCEHIDFDLVQFYIGHYNIQYYDDAEKDTSKWGFFNLSTGKIVVPAQYDYASPFYGDRAMVKKDGKCGFINPQGEIVADIIWDQIDDALLNTPCPVKKNGKWGYIDKNGKVIFEPCLETAERFEAVEPEGYAAVIKKDGKYGFIDEKVNYIFEPKFDGAKKFWRRGYAPVKGYGKWGFIDRMGALTMTFQFDDLGEGSGYFQNEGISKILGRYVEFYTVKINEKWGIIDDNFNIIMPELKNRYITYAGYDTYIKDGRITSKRKKK